MTGVILMGLGLVLGAGSNVPATPPPTIIHEQVSPFCQAFKNSVRHSVEGILTNDQIIALSKPTFLKLARDWDTPPTAVQGGLPSPNHPIGSSHNSPAVLMEENRLEQIAGALAHNIEIIQKLLNDPQVFPPKSLTSGDRDLIALKQQLETVISEQQKQLNVIYGATDTYSFESLNGRGDPVAGATGASEHNKALNDNNNYFSSGSLMGAGAPKDMNPATSADLQVISSSPYGRFYQAVEVEQNQTKTLESSLASTLMQDASQCR